MKKLIIPILVLFFGMGQAQIKKTYCAAGIAVAGESKEKFFPTLGLNFEYKGTKHSGFETGLYYRNIPYSYNYTYPLIGSNNYSVNFDSTLKYLHVPMMYKLYTKIVNFEIGVNADFYLSGVREIKHSQYSTNSYLSQTILPKSVFGFMFKISKSINLGEKMILEPEVRVNPNFNKDYGNFVGFGINLRRKFAIKDIE